MSKSPIVADAQKREHIALSAKKLTKQQFNDLLYRIGITPATENNKWEVREMNAARPGRWSYSYTGGDDEKALEHFNSVVDGYSNPKIAPEYRKATIELLWNGKIIKDAKVG